MGPPPSPGPRMTSAGRPAAASSRQASSPTTIGTRRYHAGFATCRRPGPACGSRARSARPTRSNCSFPLMDWKQAARSSGAATLSLEFGSWRPRASRHPSAARSSIRSCRRTNHHCVARRNRPACEPARAHWRQPAPVAPLFPVLLQIRHHAERHQRVIG